MELTKAHTLAIAQMKQHGLYGWSFKFDRAVSRFGLTSYNKKTISLSAPLTIANDEAQVMDTILHEIAHVLAGHAAGHGPAWARQARAIGCKGIRVGQVEGVPAKLVAVCAQGHTHHRNRQPKYRTACTQCCKQHNRGKFDDRFVLTYKANPEYALALSKMMR